jgi:hypothetical protein
MMNDLRRWLSQPTNTSPPAEVSTRAIFAQMVAARHPGRHDGSVVKANVEAALIAM